MKAFGTTDFYGTVRASWMLMKSIIHTLCLRIIYQKFSKKCCRVCFKNKPVTLEQLLGNLSQEQVNPNPVFSNYGIDYGGPFYINAKSQHILNIYTYIQNVVYFAIFSCFATKNIQLELVTDLRSRALTACIKWFIARFGKCACIISDNAKIL